MAYNSNPFFEQELPKARVVSDYMGFFFNDLNITENEIIVAKANNISLYVLGKTSRMFVL